MEDYFWFVNDKVKAILQFMDDIFVYDYTYERLDYIKKKEMTL